MWIRRKQNEMQRVHITCECAEPLQGWGKKLPKWLAALATNQ